MYSKLIALALFIGLVSCGDTKRNVKDQSENCSNVNSYIPIDSANKMISSYLNSIQYQNNDTDVRAFVVDANAIRCYLNSNVGKNVVNLKVFLAHNAEYANSLDSNKNCGYNVKGLTLVITGFDSLGNYVIYPNGVCIDHTEETPIKFKIKGNASNNLIVE
jgi:hypothetical protein